MARTARSYLRWVARAKPGDYVIALSAAAASTPVIGRHVQAIAGMTALGVGGNKYVPGIVAAMARARFEPGGRQRRAQSLAQTPTVLTEALMDLVGPEDLAQPWPSHRQAAPVWKAAGQRRYVRRAVGALRRSLQPIARRMAPRGYACRASAGTRLHPRRRLDLRAARVTGTRADGPLGQKRLGLPVSRVPDQPAASLAASDDRCQGSGRLGTGECRPVRR